MYNIILIGPVGSGKTTALRTLVEECGKKIFVVATEPGVEHVLGDTSKGGPLPEDACHWKYISPGNFDWAVLRENARLVNTLSMADLQKMAGARRNQFRQFIEVLETLCDFTCDRTGESFGPVDEFPPEWVVAVDGLSGISQMARYLTVGSKPILTQPEWGAAMETILTLVRKLCYDTKCTFILNAHLDRQFNEVGQATRLTVDTLGNKLAPEIIKPFDEILTAKRHGEDFVWSNTEINVDAKTRVLDWKDDYTPTYAHIFKKES